jgi:hypothetical protein
MHRSINEVSNFLNYRLPNSKRALAYYEQVSIERDLAERCIPWLRSRGKLIEHTYEYTLITPQDYRFNIKKLGRYSYRSLIELIHAYIEYGTMDNNSASC